MYKYKPFYISSFGGSATMWINKVLNEHPKVVSFHGTRSLPPFDSGVNDIVPISFAQGLDLMINNAENTKIFGAIHGYYGLSMYDAMKQVEGQFCAILRDPIRRINSLFNHHYKHLMGISEKNWDNNISVYVDMVGKNYDKVMLRGSNLELSEVVSTFQWICEGTIGNDMMLQQAIGNDLMFKMETLVSDKEYFTKFFAFLTSGDVMADDEYLNSIIKIKKTNQHSHTEDTNESIYNSWPDIFKFSLHNIIQKYGGIKVQYNYKQFGYDLYYNEQDFFDFKDSKIVKVS